MKPIDFSCKHDILLRDEEGNLQPMDEPYFRSFPVAADTYRIQTDGDAIYLVIGEKEALVVDSGYGCGDLRAYCQSLTDVPVRCIANTHDHFDHTANNGYFDLAYMSARTKPLATIPYPSFAGIDFPRDYPVQIVTDGDVIDLGGRTLEVFETPDHAVGSICLLDRKARILYSGDEFMVRGKEITGTVLHWKECLEKLLAHRDEFDILCAGGGVLGAELVDGQYDLVCRVLDGEEGEPDHTDHRKHPGRKQETDAQGRKIYNRWMPHPEDGPKGPRANSGFRRKLSNSVTEITYDIRHVTNE
ncbi:MAG: MBL fold metallo-hydrolase [Lachnospiraceae bacterium]|nr:MBL fold metallo-hydrolase [Lachnospiraceae bacterium]